MGSTLKLFPLKVNKGQLLTPFLKGFFSTREANKKLKSRSPCKNIGSSAIFTQGDNFQDFLIAFVNS